SAFVISSSPLSPPLQLHHSFPTRRSSDLCSSAQYLDNTVNFFLSSNHWVQFSLNSRLCKIPAELVQHGSGAFSLAPLAAILEILSGYSPLFPHGFHDPRI